MSNSIPVDMYSIYLLIPWFAASDIFPEEQIKKLESLSSESDFKEIIQQDVIPKFQALSELDKSASKLAIRVLLSATDPAITNNRPLPDSLKKYKNLSWSRFWSSILVPFTVDEKMSRRVVELIWTTLFPNENYEIGISEKLIVVRDL